MANNTANITEIFFLILILRFVMLQTVTWTWDTSAMRRADSAGEPSCASNDRHLFSVTIENDYSVFLLSFFSSL